MKFSEPPEAQAMALAIGKLNKDIDGLKKTVAYLCDQQTHLNARSEIAIEKCEKIEGMMSSTDVEELRRVIDNKNKILDVETAGRHLQRIKELEDDCRNIRMYLEDICDELNISY